MVSVISKLGMSYISELTYDMSLREVTIEGFENPDDENTYKSVIFKGVHAFKIKYHQEDTFDPEVLEEIASVTKLESTNAEVALKIMTDCTEITIEAQDFTISRDS